MDRLPKQFDVAVVGAGPAGSTAARELAKGGLNVALIEKANLPRYKTCGGGILLRAHRLCPPSIGNAIETRFHSMEVHLHGPGLHLRVQREEAITMMTMRDQFDFALVKEAERAGAALLEGRQVQEVQNSEDLVTLKTNLEDIRAKFVIGADGANSLIARKAGWRELPKRIPALEHELKLNSREQRRLGATARFDFHTVPSGYAWVFPKHDHLSIGALTTHSKRTEFERWMQRYFELLKIKDIQSSERHGHVIPVQPRMEPLSRDRILLVGDAAGLVDPLTAEGISHAILSGKLAARALIKGALNPAHTAEIYQTTITTAILEELRAARKLAWILYDQPRLCTFLFRLYGQAFCEALTEIVTGNQTYRQMLTNRRNYLRLLRFWKYGARRRR